MKKVIMMGVLCCAATTASAELTYGKAFANFHSFDSDGGDADLRSLGGGFEYTSNSFMFSGEVLNLGSDGDDVTLASVGLGYKLQNGVTLGADYTDISIAEDSTGILSGYAQYSFGAYTLGLSAGDSSDLSDTAYSIYGAWDVSDTGVVGVDFVRLEGETLIAGYADYELAQYDLRADLVSSDGLDLISFSGGYDLGNRITLIGSLSHLSEEGDDITGLILGGQYELVQGVNAQATLGRIDFGDESSTNVISLGVNYELGRKTGKRRTIGNILGTTSTAVFGIGSF